MNVEDPRDVWQRRYANPVGAGPSYQADPWLNGWQSLLECARTTTLLDLGCGPGRDTAYLLDQGYRVLSFDYARSALQTLRHDLPESVPVQVDLRQGLPLAAHCLQVIIASLSLHYFPWEQTERIVADLRRCLKVDGILLARFNSINDVQFGARGQQGGTNHYYQVGEVMKRFFDEAGLRALFAAGWQIESLAEKTIYRYGRAKVVWEVVVQKVNQ